MPRKHKGPPQESIDSILLALSRRDDISSDTLSHYLSRLDEEWTNGARQKVLQLLRSNDTSAHTAAMFILSELATNFDLDEIEEFITDPTVSDVAKLTISPLLKELNSEMADEGIIEYLNDPMGAMQQMQMRILDLVEQGEMGVQTILTDIITMPVERRLNFVEWLGSSNDPRAVSLLVPLLEGQTGKMVTAVIEALEQLGPIASSQAIPALNHLIANNSNRQLKQQARTTLGRLTMQSSLGAEDNALEEAREQQLPIYEAYSSFVDGSGAQLVMLSWQRPDGLLKIFHVFFQDQWGIKDCYGVDEVSQEHWHELIVSIRKKSFGCVLIPFEYAYALITEGRTLNKRTRRKLPISYFVWRPLIEGSAMLQPSLPSTILSASPLDDEKRALAQRGDKLFELLEFASWMYEPISRLEPYINRYWLFPLGSGASAEGKRVKGKQRSRHIVADRTTLLKQIIQEALQELIDSNWCLVYEARLRHQAALFQQVGRIQDANLCVAVAAMLHPDAQVPVQDQSFLQAMMNTSIEQGPLRMMAESLEAMGVDMNPSL